MPLWQWPINKWHNLQVNPCLLTWMHCLHELASCSHPHPPPQEWGENKKLIFTDKDSHPHWQNRLNLGKNYLIQCQWQWSQVMRNTEKNYTSFPTCPSLAPLCSLFPSPVALPSTPGLGASTAVSHSIIPFSSLLTAMQDFSLPETCFPCGTTLRGYIALLSYSKVTGLSLAWHF